MKFGRHGSLDTSPWFWTGAWDIPLDYPLGYFDYSIKVTTANGSATAASAPACPAGMSRSLLPLSSTLMMPPPGAGFPSLCYRAPKPACRSPASGAAWPGRAALRCGQVHDGDECLQLRRREGGDDLAHGARDLDLFERVVFYNALREEPREENAQAARVAVDRVARKQFGIFRGQGVAGIALLLLQVADEALNRARRYLLDSGQRAEGGEETHEVAHGALDRFDASGAVSSAGGKEVVALQKGGKIAAENGQSRRGSFTSVGKRSKIGTNWGG